MKAKKRIVGEDILQEIIRRVVEVAKPEKIILFGSAARGEMGLDSDLDILVVKAGVHRRNTARTIRRSLFGIGVPLDIVVVTPEDIERYGDCPALIIEPALRDGRVVYAS